MPYKDPKKQKICSRQHYLDNKAEYQERNRRNQEHKRAASKARLARIYDYINDIKSRPCADCGLSYPPYVMDFDHGGNEKVDGVSRLIVSASLERIKAEVEKCEVVCANCHRERTHGTVNTPA